MIKVPFNTTNIYSALIASYISGELQNIDWKYSEKTILEKANQRKFDHRATLVEVLSEQHKTLVISDKTKQNINSLNDSNCFTVCTGHQLSLLGGPSYFFTKIIDCIRLSERLNELAPDKTFVPIFWLASEDHDFEEIATFNLFGKQLTWEKSSDGATGRMDLSGTEKVLEELKSILGEKELDLANILKEIYATSDSLSEATSRLVYHFLGKYGVVVINADDAKLKSIAQDVFSQDLHDGQTEKSVLQQIQKLQLKKVQAKPRRVNLFYLGDGFRKRIDFNSEEKKFVTIGGEHTWTKEEIDAELQKFPERFSPNVLLRPVYQELILPNLAYIGGPGEIAYWLELPSLFKELGVPFPLPVVRDSHFFLPEKKLKTIEAQGLSPAQMFLSKEEISNLLLSKNIDLQPVFDNFDQKLDDFYTFIANNSPVSSEESKNIINGDKKRAEKSLDQLKNRLKNLSKREIQQKIDAVSGIIDLMFPDGAPQERKVSLLEQMLKSKKDLFDLLIKENYRLSNDINIVAF